MVSYIAAQKGYGSTDCGNQITCGCHWKGIRFLKPAALSGGVFIPFFFNSFLFLFFFFSIHRLDKREGPKKKKGKSLASTCKRNRMFVRSTVHTGARLSLRRLSLHAGRTLV